MMRKCPHYTTHLQENPVTGCPEEWWNHHSDWQQGCHNQVCSRLYRSQTAQQGRMDKAKVAGKTWICKDAHPILSNINSSTIFTLHIFDNIQIESPCSVIFGNVTFQIAQ